jgi:large subunit ribosomal protein L13
MMKTYISKKADIKRKTHTIDAEDKNLGRLSTQIARLLMGKHKPTYSPAQDSGDFVAVINAEKVKFTGDKAKKKVYVHHTGYPGGLRSITLEKTIQEHPTRVLEHAIKGMLPHTRLGARMKKRLRIYAGPINPQVTQPQTKSKKETK